MSKFSLASPFVVPADPLLAARLMAKFWKHVELRQREAESVCWWWNGYKLFQCQVQRIRYTTTAARAAWTLVYGEVLTDTDFIAHRCGNLDCVRPEHLKRYDAQRLEAEIHALKRRGLGRKAIAARLGVSGSYIDRHLISDARRKAA